MRALNALLLIIFWAIFIAIITPVIGQFHFVRTPTADQLYGCTWAQQAPNGDCR